jgi:mono/diheme cytochrome c family protein
MAHGFKLARGSDHVGTGALARPVERSSTAFRFVDCPILAHALGSSNTLKRFSRKGGIPRLRAVPVLLLMTTIALLPSCRLDMHVQPRINPLAKSDFFPDQRGARPLVEGTVARGELRDDTYFYTGKVNGNPGDYMPFPVTKDVLERGRERFNIYCSPCHSVLGDGNGFVPSRGFSKKPPSYHIPRLQKAPLGYFYDVMTNGYGIMYDYSAQVSPRDRWNIVAYIRALQLSQNATKADVPAGQSIPSEPPNFRPIGSGATLPVVAPQNPEGEPKEESK